MQSPLELHKSGLLKTGDSLLYIGSSAELFAAETLKDISFSIFWLPPASSTEFSNSASSNLPKRVTLVQGEVEGIDLDTGTIDFICIPESLSRSRYIRWALQEMARVLKPGGGIMFTLPSRKKGPIPNLKRISAKIIPDRNSAQIGRKHFYNHNQVKAILNELDFSLEPIPATFFTMGFLCRTPVNNALSKHHPFFQNLPDKLAQFEMRKKQWKDDQHNLINKFKVKIPDNPPELDTGKYADVNILVLCPHPDDEMIGCGGTLIRLKQAGAKIHILQLTDGAGSGALRFAEETKKRSIRLQEAAEAGRKACSAPRKSSHFSIFFCSELARAHVVESLVRPFRVVPIDPPPNHAPSFPEAREVVLPGALLLQAAKESLDETVLLRRVRRDELLFQSVVSAGATKPAALEDEAIVRANDRRVSSWPQSSEPADTRLFECPLGFSSASSERELIADDFAVMAIDDGGQVCPAVTTARDMRQVHGPPLVASFGLATPAANSRSRRVGALMHEPAFVSQNSVNHLSIH